MMMRATTKAPTQEHWSKRTPDRRICNTHNRNSPHSPRRRKRMNRKLSSITPPPPEIPLPVYELQLISIRTRRSVTELKIYKHGHIHDHSSTSVSLSTTDDMPIGYYWLRAHNNDLELERFVFRVTVLQKRISFFS